ncbi:hypothetical protein CEUSTIGMA_g4291.t1 [Chlamydomonas eustigma]|uniref:Nucleotide-diphospho-sugar transferase domain-containing protein n=1 Tax=Chlamydomonas eustigma TaxID=1157962 RepID=A0A250X1B0_9CHLO|nr:hypothetical protein CEUSTIGMA_g4291.t1 [Chlamydomonas eustigma]|eukprot:GAX76845.1 hypothetical protein CEUSTIGMA_g4291.t1 [Chlamydomonas eustigma]
MHFPLLEHEIETRLQGLIISVHHVHEEADNAHDFSSKSNVTRSVITGNDIITNGNLPLTSGKETVDSLPDSLRSQADAQPEEQKMPKTTPSSSRTSAEQPRLLVGLPIVGPEEDTRKWGIRKALNSTSYLTDPEGVERRAVLLKIRQHISSPEYLKRVAEIKDKNLTGIIIPAGGTRYLANLIVTLKVLRDHFKTKLHVEVMWQGGQEMKSATWGAIQTAFPPIRGVDIWKVPHPVPDMHRLRLPLTKYTGKVYSLIASEFRHVLLIDADSMPTQSPEVYLAHPQYLATGNLFWPDAWTGLVQPRAYSMHGVKPDIGRDVINSGKGSSPRDTESGQFLIDRATHLDVLEYILWINSFPKDLEGSMWGDKDTFGVAFAAAGKGHLYSQVDVPPAGLFAWRKNMLMEKATGMRSWGWQLLGFLQHDSWGRPAFIHRTINKYEIDKEPWELEMITAPMPRRWTDYYLAHENPGPTRGVPWDYVVPETAITLLEPTRTATWFSAGISASHVDESLLPTLTDGRISGIGTSAPHARCPVPSFLSIRAMQENGLPIDMEPSMQEACLPVLERLLGPSLLQQYKKNGWLHLPMMRYLDGAHMTQWSGDNEWRRIESATPLPAWKPDFLAKHCDGPFAQAVREAYAASSWIRQNAASFSLL